MRAHKRVLFLIPVITLGLLSSGAARRSDVEVHISFSGLICSIFDGQHAPRAVAMRGTADMLHHATLHIPQSSIASTDVALTCDRGDCILDLTDVALRFPGVGQAHYDKGGSYDTIVPHLSRVTNGAMVSVRDEVFDTVPSPASVVSASMLLPEGTFSATPLDQKGHYSPDFEDSGDRLFAQEVFLDGVIPTPQLLVRRFGDSSWHRVTFNPDTLIELRMVNEPADGMPPGMHHEVLYYDLSDLPLAAKPMIIVDKGGSGRSRLFIPFDPSCSTSNYP
ncbi:MAG TPA: hypothetical protein VGR95_18970 [Thermoanaerobaculia bacterium]|nr:hypothetical protein [Thermoanaerobaculia bacterium]